MVNKGNRLVIIDEQRRRDMIHDVYQGLGDRVVVLSLHLEEHPHINK